MGLSDSKHKIPKSLKQNGEVKKSKTLWMYNELDTFASAKNGVKTINRDFDNGTKKEISTKKIKKIKVFSTKRLDSK